MSVTGGIMAGVGLAGSLGSAAIEGSAATKAADAEKAAAENAAGIQGDLGQESLQNEVQTQEQNQANEQPFLQSGANGIATLDYLMGLNSPSGAPGSTPGAGPGSNLTIPGVAGSVALPGVTPLTGAANTNLGKFGELMSAYPGGTFNAPSADQARQDPGYQFALDAGKRAVNASAAANGSLLTGGTATALDQFGQGLADTSYNSVYNRALQGYNTNYNTWSNNQANQFNRLAAIANGGQVSASTLGSQGVQSAGQIANTLGNTGVQLGQDAMNVGNATASGYINNANAWSGGISGATSSLSNLLLLQQLMNKQGGGGNPYQTLYNAQNMGPMQTQGGDPTAGMFME